MAPSFIHRPGDALALEASGRSATDLLAQKDNLEIIRHVLPPSSSFEVSAPDGPDGGEIYYLLSGQLQYYDADQAVPLGPGECIAADEVTDSAYFETETGASLLQVTTLPKASPADQSNRQFTELAERIEADEHMEGHSKRVEHMATQMGHRLGISGEALDQLCSAAYFHDVGKAKVPPHIIQKPVLLTNEEWETAKRHSEWGRELLEELPGFEDVGRIVEQIHERVDGNGYPHGLADDAIRLEAKVIAVVDAYDAMTTNRPYRKAISHEEAVAELEANADTQFDPEVVAAFLAEFRNQPPTGHSSERDPGRWSQTESFLELGERILAGQNVDEILANVANAITEHTPFQRAALALYDRPITPNSIAEVSVERTAQSGLTPEEEARLRANPLPQGERKKIFHREFRLSRSCYIPIERNPLVERSGFVTGHLENTEGNWDPEDMLFIPMWLPEGQLIGLISVNDPRDGRAPTPKAIEPLELFANLAALAIQKTQAIQTLQEYQQRLHGVYQLSESLTQQTDLDELMTRASQIISEHFQYDHICLMLNEGASLSLRGFESRFPDDKINYDQIRSIPLGTGITGWVAQHNEPQLVHNVREDPRFIAGHEAMQSELAVPMTEGNEVLGVVNIESMQANAFSSRDLELLQALTRQLAVAVRNIRQRQELQSALQRQEWTNRFLQELNAAQDLDALLREVLEQAIAYLHPKAEAGNVLYYEEEPERFEFRVAVNRDWAKLKQNTYRRAELLEVLHQDKPTLLTRSRQWEAPVTRRPAEESGASVPGSTLCIPIRDPEQDELLAFFNLNNLEEQGVFTEADAARIEPLIPEITAALVRARDREHLEKQANRDPLTGVYNRHYFGEYVATERARAQRYGHPISLLLIDIDRFHEINERVGHLEGDRVLREVAGLLQRNVREADTVVRYGGDEFLALMPEIGREGAERAAARIRHQLARAESGLPVAVTATVGISTWYPKDDRSFDAVLDEADRWMYRRKGRTPRS